MVKSEIVWVAVKNPRAKEYNRQPKYEVREYKVDHRTDKAVILKCGKIYPPERCFATEEDCKSSIGDGWKKRRWGTGLED